MIEKIELQNSLENNNDCEVEKRYFYLSPFRKIKYQLITDIILARLEELIEICYKKNSNIKNLRNNDKIYVYIESLKYYKNICYVLKKSNHISSENIFDYSEEKNLLSGVIGACELIGKGWDKEAIPLINKKKSFISGFFSKLFS